MIDDSKKKPEDLGDDALDEAQGGATIDFDHRTAGRLGHTLMPGIEGETDTVHVDTTLDGLGEQGETPPLGVTYTIDGKQR